MQKYGLRPPRAVEQPVPPARRLEALLVVAQAALAEARREAIALGRRRKAIVEAEFKTRDALRSVRREPRFSRAA